MSESTTTHATAETATRVLSIAPDALEMIITLRDQEPGDEEYALRIAIRGVMGFQFNYDLAFVPVADKADDERVEYHGDLAVIVPEADVENLSGAALELSPQGLTMNNPNTPAPPPMAAPKGDLTGPLAERVQQVLVNQVNPAIAAHGGAAELVSVDGHRIPADAGWMPGLRPGGGHASPGDRADPEGLHPRARPGGGRHR